MSWSTIFSWLADIPLRMAAVFGPRVEKSTAFWCLYSPQMVRLRRSGTAAPAYDTTVGGDYCENDSLNLITWDVSDSGDPDIGMAMNVQFGNNGADGVFFFAASAGVDLSSFVGNGKLKFDLRLPRRPRQPAWFSGRLLLSLWHRRSAD